jgi:hypothetical protein
MPELPDQFFLTKPKIRKGKGKNDTYLLKYAGQPGLRHEYMNLKGCFKKLILLHFP